MVVKLLNTDWSSAKNELIQQIISKMNNLKKKIKFNLVLTVHHC